ncbi:MAG: tetratricopeptide repeat protein [Candidatus Latescibacteria bacterium]|nr:tetratricopeptide repeat protein [Candidatus Latescibacterota bacterium]
MKFRLSDGVVLILCGFLFLGLFSSVEARRKSKKDEHKPREAPVDSGAMSRKHVYFGKRYLDNKQYEDARVQLTKSWNFNSRNAQTAYYLGKLYNETEEPGEAITWFKKAIELNPAGPNARNALYYLGQLYIQEGMLEEAIEVYEKLLAIAKKSEKQVQYLHRLVTLYIEIEDYDSALKHTRSWGGLEPDNPDVQDAIAKLTLYMGDEDEALKEMERLLEINPEDYATLDNLAKLYVRMGMDQKAFNAYEKLHAHSPEDLLYLDQLLNLGKQLNKSRRFQINILRKMIRLQPDNLSVVEQLADLTGDIGLVDRGLRLDPGNGKFNYMRGEYHHRKWKKSNAAPDSVNALKWFRRAAKDPLWAGNAKRMIDEIDPPMSEEEKKRLEFFKKKKDEEVDIEGKK